MLSNFLEWTSSKKKRSRKFCLECLIRACVQEKALADLRASINMMPYSILKKLWLGEQKKNKDEHTISRQNYEASKGDNRRHIGQSWQIYISH